MKRSAIVDRMISSMNNIHELGRQRAFELDNPFYFQLEGNGEYYRKELNTGEIYLVKVEVEADENDIAF